MISKRLNWFVLLVAFWLVPNAMCQSPNFLNVGSEEFSNLDVYTVFYDTSQEVLYAGTDDGVYQYTQNKFSKMKMPNSSRSNSYFRIEKDSNGLLYCYNLNGQLFRLKNNKWELYFNVENFGLDMFSNYEISKSGVIYFITNKKIFKIVDGEKTVDLVTLNGINSDSLLLFKSHTTSNGRLFLKGKYKKKWSWIEVVNDSLVFTVPYIPSYAEMFDIDNSLFEYSEKIHSPENIVVDFQAKPFNSACFSTSDYACILYKTIGMSLFHLKNDTLTEKGLFENEFISTFCKDEYNNAYLGTFKSGVNVVSKLNQISVEFDNHRIRSLVAKSDDVCFAGTQSGSLFEMSQGVSFELVSGLVHSIEHLYYDQKKDKVVFSDKASDNSVFRAENKIVRLSKFDGYSKMYTASNDFGYLIKATTIQKIFWNSPEPKSELIYTNHKKLFSIFANTFQNQISFSDNQDTYIKSINQDDAKALKYQNQSFSSAVIKGWNDKTIYATKKNGILIFKGDKFLNRIANHGDLSFDNNVKDLVVKDDIAFFIANGKLKVYDLLKNKFISVGFQDGIGSQTILAISASENKLWIAEEDKVYNVDVKDLLQVNYPSNIYIDSIKVNGVLMNWSENEFQYSDKGMNIYYDYRDLISKEDVRIEYKLIGLENEWKEISAFDNVIEFKSLPAGDYKFQIKCSIGNQKGQLISYPFSIKPPFWKSIWFFLLIILLVLLVAVLIFYYISKAQRRKAKTIIEKERLSARLLASQLKVLRSQMNPHFIFNSLASIQDLVVSNETLLANDYLVDFSSLLRDMLNNSASDFITIRKEIDFLNCYLNLEKCRFEKDFEFSIEKSVSDTTMIPSMMVQPFVENSIQHGLIHKSGLKKIQVNFSIEEDYLVCQIQDNGIGRVASRKIQEEKKYNSEQSFSTKATKERIALFNQQYKVNATIQIIDLKEQNEVTGTLVILKLPMTQKV